MTERMIVDVPKHPFILRDELGEIVQKHDQSKPRFSLLPQVPLWQVVEVLEFGAGKYGADNWRKVPNARERYFNACHRHLNAWWAGEMVDNESGLPPLPTLFVVYCF